MQTVREGGRQRQQFYDLPYLIIYITCADLFSLLNRLMTSGKSLRII